MFRKLTLSSLLVAAVALPVLAFNNTNSGLNVGEVVTPFHPKHVAGPDKGTDTCPPCKYGSRPAVQVWVNGDEFRNVKAIAKAVSSAVDSKKDAQFKGFVVFVVDKEMAGAWATRLEKMAEIEKLTNIGITVLEKGNEAIANYKVNTDAEVKNTIFLYKDKKVSQKFVNLKADEAGMADLSKAIEQITTQP